MSSTLPEAAALEVRDCVKRFRGFGRNEFVVAADSIHLRAAPGPSVAGGGANGAGKSSLLSMC
ncbi:MAG: hypothetical protein AB7F74_20105, partial [Parvibaculaceae bacterium]